VSIRLAVPESIRPGPVVAWLRVRRLDDAAAVPLTVTIGPTTTTLTVDGGWQEHHIDIPQLAAARLDAELVAPTPGTRLDVDHLLLIPARSP
jgi:hypothetical protein